MADPIIVEVAAFAPIVVEVAPGNATNAGVAGFVTQDGPTKDALSAKFVAVALVADGITYNPDGSVATTTQGGVVTTYTYNADGSVNTETRLGKTKTWAYDGSGNPTGSVVV